jgi:preprotein translocase subunit SecD
MDKKLIYKLVFIIVITALAIVIDIPSGPNLKFWLIDKKLDIVQGLDLKGGVHLEYEADFKDIPPEDQKTALSGAINVIEKRINSLGVTEASIREVSFGGKAGILVELPGISDTQQALDIIGKTAKLEFQELIEDREQKTGDGFQPGWKKTGLGGEHLIKAEVTFTNSQSRSAFNRPQISIKFNSEGRKLFDEITGRNLQKPSAIILDDQLISAPTVQNQISTGEAVITGEFTLKEAKNLALQLNSGALPVDLKLVSQRSIGATLGKQSIEKSLIAGLLGLAVVLIFMILYYRLSGLIASLALIIYILIVLAIFKLIPVTLTLAGIAGFILSVGVAVDANILIFERTKEELQKKVRLKQAIETGFSRAWTSIRDSNVTSIITALILIWLGSGIVRGFAVTLLIGILISMFSAITVSKTLMLLILREKKR